MSFPQSSADLAVQNGQEYWRLFTEMVSSGDIFETPQSGRAFAIGPQSDISRVKIVYYDRQNANLANEVIVSVDKPHIGRLDALGSETYQSGDRARLLISAADFGPPPGAVNPFRPPTALAPTGAADGTVIQTVFPRIDLLQYLNKEPSFIAPRVDRVHQFDQAINTTGDQQWFLVPFFGRRFLEVGVKTRGVTVGMVTTPPIDVYVYGIDLSWILSDVGIGDGDSGHQQEMLGSFHLNAPSTGAGVSDFVTASNRSFDYVAVQLQKPNGVNYPIETAVNLHIVVSDKI